MQITNSLRAFAAAVLFVLPAHAEDKLAFWDTPQRGANAFNAAPHGEEYYAALAETGATWVRLAFSKWAGKSKDFLIGDADNYEGLVQEDLAVLRKVLDTAGNADLKVVVTPLTLPGSRWIQQNGRVFDDRIWSDPDHQAQAVRFWGDLAAELKDHPAIAGYNILNEPAPEKNSTLAENANLQSIKAWQSSLAGGPRDLRTFYSDVIAAIRAHDPATPVMVDSGWYANPKSLAAWPEPLADDKVIYAFHMYEPWVATSPRNMKRETPRRYPGTETDYGGKTITWDSSAVSAHIDHAFDWAKQHGLPATRIAAAEFGCMRRWEDCGRYLTDVLDAVENRGGHWAFYAFREDEWEGMDYELPTDMPPGRFYWLKESGKEDRIPRDGALMDILRERMGG